MSIDFDALRPGEVVIYAKCGSLARLRASTKRQPDPQLEAANAAWQAALRGQIDLLQRRCESGFQYLAIGRRALDPQPVQPHYQEVEIRRTRAA
jgi:hypothetical protein